MTDFHALCKYFKPMHLAIDETTPFDDQMTWGESYSGKLWRLTTISLSFALAPSSRVLPMSFVHCPRFQRTVSCDIILWRNGCMFAGRTRSRLIAVGRLGKPALDTTPYLANTVPGLRAIVLLPMIQSLGYCRPYYDSVHFALIGKADMVVQV